MPVPLTLSLVAVFVAVLIVRLGLRGRRVGNHPHCAACEHDLHGLPGDSARCPECGADLSAAGAVRVGRRERRWAIVTAGAVLAAVGLAVGAGAAMRLSTGDAYALVPVGALRWQATLGPSAAEPAARELARRVASGEVGAAAARSIAADFLDHQADAGRAWAAAKGDLIEHARLAGHLGDAAWQRYGEQGYAPGLRVRPVVRAGRGVPIEIDAAAMRFGTADAPLTVRPAAPGGIGGPSAMFEVELRWVLTTDAGGPAGAVVADAETSGFGFGWPAGMVISISTSRPEVPASAAGRTLSLRLDFASRRAPGSPAPPAARALARVRVVPADEPTVRVVTDPALAPRVRSAVTVARGNGQRAAGVTDWGEGRNVLSVSMPVSDALPVPLAFVAEVDDGRAVRTLGREVIQPPPPGGSGGVTIFGYRMEPGFDADVIDLTLRPDPDLAEGTTGVTEVWGGPIRFERLPVHWPRGVARPLVARDD